MCEVVCGKYLQQVCAWEVERSEGGFMFYIPSPEDSAFHPLFLPLL